MLLITVATPAFCNCLNANQPISLCKNPVYKEVATELLAQIFKALAPLGPLVINLSFSLQVTPWFSLDYLEAFPQENYSGRAACP